MLVFIGAGADAQKDRPKNLEEKFSGKNRRFHFGFLLGYNTCDYFTYTEPDFTFQDSILSIVPRRAPGFILGIVSSLHLDNNWKLRFLPTLSFEDRVFDYRFLESDGSISTTEVRVESTFIQFPLLLKFRTNRVNNWCAYLIGGGQYGIDLAANLDVVNTNVPADILKTVRNDWALQIGGGFDFFLQYFKFGIELKLHNGLNNSLVQDNSYYSTPLSRLRTRAWLVSFTFEG